MTARRLEAARRESDGLVELAQGNASAGILYRVKRQPLQAVGVALGVGVVLGLAVGWMASSVRRE